MLYVLSSNTKNKDDTNRLHKNGAQVLISCIAICCSKHYQIIAIRFDSHTQNHSTYQHGNLHCPLANLWPIYF